MGGPAQAHPVQPFDYISLPEPAPTPQFCPNAEQIAALLAAADEEDRPLFTFLACTGCRIGEAAELRSEDVVFGADGGHLLIRRVGSQGTTKTGGIRRIPIHPELLPVLKGFRNNSTTYPTHPAIKTLRTRS